MSPRTYPPAGGVDAGSPSYINGILSHPVYEIDNGRWMLNSFQYQISFCYQRQFAPPNLRIALPMPMPMPLRVF